MKKTMYISSLIVLLTTSCIFSYLYIKNTRLLSDLNVVYSELSTQYDSLAKKNSENDKKIKNLKTELDKAEKDLKIAKDKLGNGLPVAQEQFDKPTIDDTNSVNSNNEYHLTHKMPITEYKVPTNEDMEKYKEQHEEELADQQQKDNEPQYAIAGENNGGVFRFSADTGITVDEFYKLNPNFDTYTPGDSYRIK